MNDTSWLAYCESLQIQIAKAKLEVERYQKMASDFLLEMENMRWEINLLKGKVKP